jgi:hypothetical protein
MVSNFSLALLAVGVRNDCESMGNLLLFLSLGR